MSDPFWTELVETEPNRLQPENVYVVRGPAIHDLPEAKGAPHMLGTFSAYLSVFTAALHPDLPAIIAFRIRDLSPSILRRIAGREWLVDNFGTKWWSYEGMLNISVALSQPKYARQIIVPTIAERRASYPVDFVRENYAIPVDMENFVPLTAYGGEDELVEVSVADLLEAEFPEPQYLIEPWLRLPGLAMIFAERGVGKSLLACSIAHAVSTGRPFLGWTA